MAHLTEKSPNLSDFEAVIFDMDGVLIDSEPYWKLAEIAVFATVGVDYPRYGGAHTVGLRIDEVVEFVYQRAPWQRKSKEQIVAEIIERMRQYILEEGVALAGVYAAIEKTHALSIPMAIATSSFEVLMHSVLEKLDIAHFFSVTQSAEKLPFGKPHPEVYLKTAQRLGIKPEKCLVVEDSLNGIIAAKAAKMKVLVVPEKTHAIDPRFVLGDYYLESLERLG
jgi:HAD superfamily hydrolase (TIGR01509 family)